MLTRLSKRKVRKTQVAKTLRLMAIKRTRITTKTKPRVRAKISLTLIKSLSCH